MKSEFYRQISNQNKTRKSTTKQKHKKQGHLPSHINPLKFSKGQKSVSRTLVRSIDLKKNKPSTDQRMMRISFSRPLIFNEDEPQPIQIHEQSVVSICYECQTLKIDHQRQVRELKMHFEQELTGNTEKFIQMQKKYLYKDSQYIQLSSNHLALLNSYHELEQKLQLNLHELEDWKQKCLINEQQLSSLREEIKRFQDQNQFFNHFLTAFVEQTKCMINWCNLFERTCEQLPAVVNLIKEDLFYRKVDLDLMLKESIQYKKTNFNSQPLKQHNQSSFFFESEDSSSSFMKYFNHNSTENKRKRSRMFPLTQIKHHSHDIEGFELNKENIDIANRPSFEFLIQSRLNQKIEKQKYYKINDQFLRILLAQAQTIESSFEIKTTTPVNRSHHEISRSLFSTFSEKAHNDIY